MNTSLQQIGIDALAFDVPESYVELSDLAEARGIQKEKYLSGLGVKQMAVALPKEDPVALAVNAARRLLRFSQQDPKEIGLCIVGTETAVDHAKPISSFLHSMLGLSSSCRVFETKHACFGGTAGLFNALDWIASGSARGKKALIVCTDIARYPLETAGEPTQGAGAVALLISQNPRLMTLSPSASGSYARDVYDFWRPLNRKDALTDGHFSVQCYLEALAGSYAEWKNHDSQINALQNQNKLQNQKTNQSPLSGQAILARTCYHVPYGKMAKKAHRHRMMLDGKTEQEADDSFLIEVAPSLEFSSQIGNIYTGSLYLALASLLFQQAEQLSGQNIGFFSYGSGCAAEFFSGQVQPGAHTFVKQLRLDEPLQTRRCLSIAEYENIRKADETADLQKAPSGLQPWTGKDLDVPKLDQKVVFLGIDESERRVYKNQETPKSAI